MDIFALATQPEAWAALAALMAMEIVLGIDNLVFISVVTNKLPMKRRPAARRIGIGLALIMRLVLLSMIAWIVTLDRPIFEILGQAVSWKDIILLVGGLFLVWKATREIRHKVDPDPEKPFLEGRIGEMTMMAAIGQIVMLDLVFSIDSIITAVGMTPHLPLMVIAVVAAIIAMLLLAEPLGTFLDANPTVLMLALGFMLMIGMTLIAEGSGFHVPKGYIYSAMAFSALIETLNILARKRRERRLPG